MPLIDLLEVLKQYSGVMSYRQSRTGLFDAARAFRHLTWRAVYPMCS